MLSPLAPVPRLEPAPRNATPDDAQAPEPGTRFSDLLRERHTPAPPASAGDRSADAAASSDTADPAQAAHSSAAVPARIRPSPGASRQAGKDDPLPAPARPSTSAQPALSTLEAAQEPSSEQASVSDPGIASDALPTLPSPGALQVPPSVAGAQAFDTAASRPPGTKSARDAAQRAGAAQSDAIPAGPALAAESAGAPLAAPGPIVSAPAESLRGEPLDPGPEPATPATAPPSFARVMAQAAPPAVALPAPLAAPNFGEALAAQVSVFARDGVQQAELRLNPPEMGPIGVQIELVGNDARINFHAAQAQTREIIERALPELAGALRHEGLTLAGGGVFDRPADGRGGGFAERRESSRPQRASVESLPAAPARARLVRQGGVDLYA